MGMCTGPLCCKSMAVMVALFAIFIGALVSGGVQKTGIFRYLDRSTFTRGAPLLKGMFPATHEGTPWGFTMQEMPDLSGETFLVTGANAGLGYWTAHHLASKHGNVILGCRSVEKCESAAGKIRAATGGTVETLRLDLSSFKSIRAAAKTFAAGGHASLDGLILNAGIMVPPFALTEDGIESQIGTNHFGHFLLTQLLMPELEAAAAQKGVATVVAVSSAAHYDSYPGGILPSLEHMNDEKAYDKGKAYGQSKLANVLFAQELSERVRHKGILVNSVHPGGVDTELFRHVFNDVKRVSTALGEWLENNMLSMFAWDPKDAALTQLNCAVGPKVRQGKVTGRYYHPIARETRPDLHAFNASLQKHLWSMTEQVIGPI